MSRAPARHQRPPARDDDNNDKTDCGRTKKGIAAATGARRGRFAISIRCGRDCHTGDEVPWLEKGLLWRLAEIERVQEIVGGDVPRVQRRQLEDAFCQFQQRAELVLRVVDEMVLRPKQPRNRKLSWNETYKQMAQSDEDWSAWESLPDGLDGLPSEKEK